MHSLFLSYPDFAPDPTRVLVNRSDVDRYTKALTKTTTRLEALLKVIVTPVVGGLHNNFQLLLLNTEQL